MKKAKCDYWMLFFARLFISVIFLASAFGKIMDPISTKEYMVSTGMFWVGFFYFGAVFLEIFGGLFVLLGYKLEIGTLFLILFLVPTTIIFHTNFSDINQIIQFQKNLAILGGLLALNVCGAGSFKFGK
tara:strand:+ start:1341 stop:1727 length:387 start_codon:yes stop_codon:yes gene_type:complete